MFTLVLSAYRARVALILRALSVGLKEHDFLWMVIPRYLNSLTFSTGACTPNDHTFFDWPWAGPKWNNF